MSNFVFSTNDDKPLSDKTIQERKDKENYISFRLPPEIAERIGQAVYHMTVYDWKKTPLYWGEDRIILTGKDEEEGTEYVLAIKPF